MKNTKYYYMRIINFYFRISDKKYGYRYYYIPFCRLNKNDADNEHIKYYKKRDIIENEVLHFNKDFVDLKIITSNIKEYNLIKSKIEDFINKNSKKSKLKIKRKKLKEYRKNLDLLLIDLDLIDFKNKKVIGD